VNEALAISLHVSQRVLPDLDALWGWVRSPERIARDGRVLSWSNPAHPGYPYDEATAVFAHLFQWQGDPGRSRDCIAVVRERLESGWLGRAGSSYVFDTALALPLVDDAGAVQRVVGALRDGRACQPVTRPDHWSQIAGPHLLKCALWLARVGQAPFARQLADRLVDTCFEDGRFRIRSGSPVTYLHSHCYALEGLLGLSAWQRCHNQLVPRSYGPVLDAGAQWLARVQLEDGSLPDYIGQQSRCRPSDVLAQAIRIWSVVDPIAYDRPIAVALQRLAARQNPATGGIAYHEASDDECSWVAAFALQACSWAVEAPKPGELQCLV